MFRAQRSSGATRLLAPYTAMPHLIKPADGSPATLPPVRFDVSKGVGEVLSGAQLSLHYNKHHKAYVDKMNALLDTKYAGSTIEAIARTALSTQQTVLFNQAAQHFNHAFYWNCIAAVPAGTPPEGVPAALCAQIEKDFQSFPQFMKQMEESAVANFGSGWTWLVWNSEAHGFSIVNSGNAAAPHLTVPTDLTSGKCQVCPVLTIDVWEHAYYKDYENRRADYVKQFWRIVDWKAVCANWERAMAAE